MTALQAVAYGLIQGLTEFLPVSSSGHLALYRKLVGDTAQDPLLLPVLVHVASLGAIVIVFRREVRRLFFEDRRLGVLLLVGTVPAAVVGLLFHDAVDRLTGLPVAVGACLIVNGIVLAAGELAARSRSGASRPEQSVRPWEVLVIGVCQALALLPGVSRSGMTMSSARSLGLARDASVRLSFLLAVPAMAGAGGYETLKLMRSAQGAAAAPELVPTLLAFVVAFGSSWLALLLLIRIVRRVGLWVFAPYCLAVGAAAVLFFGLARG